MDELKLEKSCYQINLKLSKLVEKHPCIYKRTSYYTSKDNNSYADGAWAKIAEEMGDSVVACKKRWKSIRAAYARSVNIYKTPNGPNRHKRYYLHDHLQFLTDHIPSDLLLKKTYVTPNKSDTNRKESRKSIDISDDSSCTFEAFLDLNSLSPPASVIKEPIQEENNVSIFKADPEPEPKPEPESESEPEYEEQPPRAKKYRDSNEFPILNMPQESDPDSDFLKNLLPELKNMNPRQKIKFRGKIFQALEEVLSDPTDFPQKHNPSVSESSLQTTAPATQGALARRSFSNRIFTDRRETLPGENSHSQNGNFSIIRVDESHTQIRTEIQSVDENY